MTCSSSLWIDRALLGIAALAFVGLAGCGSPKFYPVRGEVILAETGRPLTGGEVRFRPVSKPDLVATGSIGKNGKFSLSTPSHGEGVLEGRCRGAVIVPPQGGRRVIQERYENFDTSELWFTVTAREENYFLIEVHRAGR